jgi:5-methylphenazine-1-carboxylate 1-monooxygenase
MRIAIAGAGVGGLAAALSLHAAGFTRIEVFEAAPQLWPLGVGLNILPNAVRELSELGVYEQVARDAVATGELRLCSRHGKLIWSEPRGLAAGYRWPQLSVHRGHLLGVLASAVAQRLGPDAIVPGARVVRFRDRPDGVVLTLRRAGAGQDEDCRADVLVGADGIHSAVRACLHPGEGPPPGNGLVMWRGTTWGEPFLDGQSMIVMGTDTERLVLYPIAGRGSGARSLINWVAARPSDNPPEPGDWQQPAAPGDVLHHFGSWSSGSVDIPAVLAGAACVYRYPMIDRDPLSRWGTGHVTLLGDAAHAMYPMGSNGATQAIMDARVLARELALAASIPQALAGYEAQRRPAMTSLQASNRQQGPEAVIATVHQRAPGGFENLRDVITDAELGEISARYASTAGFDVEHVNTRASLSVNRRTSP